MKNCADTRQIQLRLSSDEQQEKLDSRKIMGGGEEEEEKDRDGSAKILARFALTAALPVLT